MNMVSWLLDSSFYFIFICYENIDSLISLLTYFIGMYELLAPLCNVPQVHLERL